MTMFLLISSLCLIFVQVNHAQENPRNPILSFIIENIKVRKLSQEKVNDFILILESMGERINDPFPYNTPLTFASLFKMKDTVKLLLDYGADPDVKDGYGRVALHVAAEHCSYDIVVLLLAADADISITYSLYDSWTPLDLAKKHPWWACFRTQRLLEQQSGQLSPDPSFPDVRRMPRVPVERYDVPVMRRRSSDVIDDSSLVPFTDVDAENDRCIICLEHFESSASKIRKCKTCEGSYYHDHCIRPWIIEPGKNCPICRQPDPFIRRTPLSSMIADDLVPTNIPMISY